MWEDVFSEFFCVGGRWEWEDVGGCGRTLEDDGGRGRTWEDVGGPI